MVIWPEGIVFFGGGGQLTHIRSTIVVETYVCSTQYILRYELLIWWQKITYLSKQKLYCVSLWKLISENGIAVFLHRNWFQCHLVRSGYPKNQLRWKNMKVTSRYGRWREVISFWHFNFHNLTFFVRVSSYLNEIRVFLHRNWSLYHLLELPVQ